MDPTVISLVQLVARLERIIQHTENENATLRAQIEQMVQAAEPEPAS